MDILCLKKCETLLHVRLDQVRSDPLKVKLSEIIAALLTRRAGDGGAALVLALLHDAVLPNRLDEGTHPGIQRLQLDV